jgi:hypothetical protein
MKYHLNLHLPTLIKKKKNKENEAFTNYSQEIHENQYSKTRFKKEFQEITKNFQRSRFSISGLSDIAKEILKATSISKYSTFQEEDQFLIRRKL